MNPCFLLAPPEHSHPTRRQDSHRMHQPSFAVMASSLQGSRWGGVARGCRRVVVHLLQLRQHRADRRMLGPQPVQLLLEILLLLLLPCKVLPQESARVPQLLHRPVLDPQRPVCVSLQPEHHDVVEVPAVEASKEEKLRVVHHARCPLPCHRQAARAVCVSCPQYTPAPLDLPILCLEVEDVHPQKALRSVSSSHDDHPSSV
mmetsp:Transcript_6838/g.24000  ORF Transcript_6838/g.24000 Transcript_6838/m.24000 type:complete len:202 (-) Transcript_6838:1260-1865(-)